MMADTDAARRPKDRGPLRLIARAASALALAALAVTAAATPVVPAPAASAAEGDVTVSIAAGSSTLQAGQDLAVTVTVTNSRSAPVPAGSITVVLDRQRIDSRGELDTWLTPKDDEPLPDGPSATIEATQLDPARSTSFSATIPAAALGLDGAAWGVRGIAAQYVAGGETVGDGRGAVTWYTGDAVTANPLVLAMPLTVPATATGLLTAEDLSGLTRPGGLLTRQLDGVIGRDVAVGIDPMIIASIRALGTSAPASATEWLDRLASIGNETFPLAWADADISAQVQAGLTHLLTPISLGYAMKPADFPTAAPTPTATSSSTAAPTASTTPSPTPTQAPSTVPTIDQLLAWPYTMTGVAWPAAGTVAAADLPVFMADGFGTTIVASSDLSGDGGATPRFSAQAGASPVELSDARLSSAISRAATAVTDAEWRAAMDEATAVLAVASSESAAGTPLLAALDRGWPATSTRLPQTLSAIAATPWSTPESFTAAQAGPRAAITIADAGENASRVAVVPQLTDGEAQLTQFATALADPTVLTGPERNQLLGLLSNGWHGKEADWTVAVGEHQNTTRDTLNSVSVVQSSEVNVVGTPAEIPIAIRNAFTSPVTVHVQATPTNGRLVVDRGVDATIDAGASATVRIPVQAQVGSGEVQLVITMTSPTGVQIGATSTLSVNVQADWEGLGAAILGVLVVLFFGYGIVRNVRRRRRQRAEEEAEAGAVTAAGPAPESDAPESGAPEPGGEREGPRG